MSEFLMPSLGADMESAVLMEWLVSEGDQVGKGDVIAEVETDKGVIEIEVFEDGIIEKFLVEPDTQCNVGEPLALIRTLEGDENSDESVQKEQQKLAATEKRIKISPVARKRADELGVDINMLASKTDGVIQLSQVEDAAVKKDLDKPLDKSSMRQAIAAAMSRSNTDIPHYYLSTSINMTKALKWLEELNSKRNIKERILPVALLIKAVVQALKEVPQLNGFYKDDEHKVSELIHPGIAIAQRKGGLITPALLNAHDMSLDNTMESLADLINRTRTGKLKSTQMNQQTITITNLGDLGVESVYGVIYPPQIAIVGFGRIVDTPWVIDDTVEIQKIMQATLSGDHRATDGRTGALFLDKLNHLLQIPQELL